MKTYWLLGLVLLALPFALADKPLPIGLNTLNHLEPSTTVNHPHSGHYKTMDNKGLVVLQDGTGGVILNKDNWKQTGETYTKKGYTIKKSSKYNKYLLFMNNKCVGSYNKITWK
jgi:hypothetical protein